MSKIVNINFDDGFKEITINGDKDRVVRWNPGDFNFVDKYIALTEWLKTDFEVLVKEFENAKFIVDEDGELTIEGYEKGYLTKIGEELSSKFDDTFGFGMSEAAFQGAHPLTTTPTGFLFGNFIEALSPIIEESFKENDEGMDKYLNRAKKIKKQTKG